MISSAEPFLSSRASMRVFIAVINTYVIDAVAPQCKRCRRRSLRSSTLPTLATCESKRLQVLDEIGLLSRGEIQAEQLVVVIHDREQVRRAPVVEIRSVSQAA